MNQTEFNNEASMREARARLPLDRVIEQYGHAPQNGRWKDFACPFCQKKRGAGLFKGEHGGDLFKCHHATCRSAGKVLDEVGFIMEITGQSRRDAFVAYLKMANVWRDRQRWKGEGNAEDGGRKAEDAGQRTEGSGQQSEQSGSNADASSSEHEGLIEQCVEVIRAEQKASVSLLQRRLRLGYTRASRLMDELESRGIVGPSNGAESRDIFVDLPEEGGKAAKTAASRGRTSDYLPSEEEQAAIDAEMARQKEKEQADESQNTEKPDQPGNVVAFPGKTKPSKAKKPSSNGAKSTSTDSKDSDEAASSDKPHVRERLSASDIHEKALEALETFYQALTLTPQDEETLFRKRGLTSHTIEVLGYRSSPESNKQILAKLREKFSREVLLALGLFKPVGAGAYEIKPNAQFYGFGVAGRREAKPGEKLSDDEKFVWDWTHPILIPFRDERGRLTGLRPHKGMANADTVLGTPKVYIPRRSAGGVERFHTVVVTEGEFKAAALWQMVGSGCPDGEPLGVVALPGINFARNYDVQGELYDWITDVEAKEVIVAYDSEEKGDPKLPGYKPELQKRFDSVKWARFLAIHVSRTLHVHGKVAMLPHTWRDENGKADWDGFLAREVAA